MKWRAKVVSTMVKGEGGGGGQTNARHYHLLIQEQSGQVCGRGQDLRRVSNGDEVLGWQVGVLFPGGIYYLVHY